MKLKEKIKHDGGSHNVEIYTEGDQAVIRFGASFTLRVDEENIDKLRVLFYDASRELAIRRRDDIDVPSEMNIFSVEDEMIQHGIDAREQLKAQAVKDYDPNDPVTW